MNKVYLLCIISALLATTAIVVKIVENKKTEVKPVGPFVPTNEWQEVLPGQAVPKGLKIRMDFNTHKKYAKLDDGVEDKQNMGVIVSDKQPEIPIHQKKEMDEADKLAKLITDTLLNKNEETAAETSDQMKERVLLSLPEPLQELKNYSSLSEEEKKKIIDSVWEKRQRDLEEAMKNIRGDDELMIEHLNTLKSLLPQLQDQIEENVLQQIDACIQDIQWLILDVDNVENFLKLGGEKVLVDLLNIIKNNGETPLLTDLIVTIATMYKNTISLQDFSTAASVLSDLISLTKTTSPSSLQFLKKMLYSINILISNKPQLGKQFLDSAGMKVIIDLILGNQNDLKRKSLEIYRNLFQMFEQNPLLSTSNICTQALIDLTEYANREDYPLIQSYFELLKQAKIQNELSCILELQKSGVFMNTMRSQYTSIRELARQEVQEEGEESYYTSLVYLLHFVFDKDIE